ncbi:MAG: ferritin-like domain-containing protein [Rhodobacter sp.]|nr:ferritin-like domain-containing protein [Rhodobacter sp.]
MTDQTSSVSKGTQAEIDKMSKETTVSTLKTVLRAAIKLEMATIPIYLYTYYSLCRKPGQDEPPTRKNHPVPAREAFPHESSLFANEAGATIMSVAVEEMLHLSLAMNLLTSMLEEGETLPQIYDELTFGASGGIVLPDLSMLTKKERTQLGRPKIASVDDPKKPVEKVTGAPLEIPLDKFCLDQTNHFMRIEYPAVKGSVSEKVDLSDPEWATIGEVYDFAKALIHHLQALDPAGCDAVFQKNLQGQIGPDNYSGSNIDTLSSGKKPFAFKSPPPADKADPKSAAHVAKFENNDHHDHVGEGAEALERVWTAQNALDAIDTICEQGEGSDYSGFVEDDNKKEESHYFKFWSLSAMQKGYKYDKKPPQVAGMTPPSVPDKPLTEKELLARFVYDVPKNPKASDYCEAARALVDVANGLFQYMLIMTETTLLVPPPHQKLYFNKAMHQSMIWVMDKFFQDLRHVKDRGRQVVPTFENPFPVGTTRETAFAALTDLVTTCQARAKVLSGYNEHVEWNMGNITALPDVSMFWNGNDGVTPAALPAYLNAPTETQVHPDPSKAGHAAPVAKIDNKGTNKELYRKFPEYEGKPAFPGNPPTDAALDASAGFGNWVRHACMGLNSCKNQGRTLNNDCAGQGWCSTALGYNAASPAEPYVSDHTCHVKNNCRGQGGCGLYGTEEELSTPGGNACQARGSCATPINAERFITEGENRQKSVWNQAREHFQAEFGKAGKSFGKPPADYPSGPRIQWIEASGHGMTACGASGMSGAGSCA